MPFTELPLDCPYEFQLGFEPEYFNYEATITFNPTLYTIGSAYNDGVKLVEQSLLNWLEDQPVLYVYIVMEYQKSQMPHLHVNVVSDTPLDILFRANMVKGLQRIAGRSTFKPVINIEAFETYMQKDLKVNYEKSGIPHFKVFTKN